MARQLGEIVEILERCLRRRIDRDYGLMVPRIPAPVLQSFARRSRKALVTTETELIAIAAPANIGESSKPKKG